MMLNKPVRTYERKKGGGHCTTRTIIREDIPPDRENQPMEALARDDDDSMDIDPFDTTFDRLLKTAKMPPKPPSDGSESSYDSSSNSDVKTVYSNDEPPIPELLIDEEPTVKKQRVYNPKKINESNLTLITGRLRKLPKRLGVRNKSNSLNDENAKPDVEEPAAEKKRGKTNAATRKNKTAKERVMEKRTPIAVYRGRRKGSVNNRKSLMQCSVNLTKANDALDKSKTTLGIRSDASDNKTKQYDDPAIPGPSNIGEINENRFAVDQDERTKEFVAKPAIVVDTVLTSTIEKQSDIFKNPRVSLSRLRVPQRQSIANKNWMSSTPITHRTIRNNSLLRFSPIDTNETIKLRVRHGYDNSGEDSLPSNSSEQAVEPATVESETPNSQQSSEKGEENSSKRRPIVLSDSPAIDPSCLMFEDTEAPDEHSDIADVSVEKEICKDTTEASTTSPFKGFSTDSSDPESVQLHYEAVDKSESSSENLVETDGKAMATSTAAEQCSMIAEENHRDTAEASSSLNELTNNSSDTESIHLTVNYDDEDNASSSKDLRNSVEYSHSVSLEQTAPSEHLGEIIDASTNEKSKEYSEDSKNSSDDQWMTIPGSPDAETDVSNEKKIPIKNPSETSEPRRRESIVQLSSNDDSTSSDDIAELINANEVNSNNIEKQSKEEKHLADEESLSFEDINGNESKIEKTSKVEVTNNKNSCKNILHDLMNPYVLLRRINIASNTSKNSSLNSADYSVARVESARLPARKLRRMMNVEESNETEESTDNASSCSVDDKDSGIKTAVTTRKSRKITGIKISETLVSVKKSRLNTNAVKRRGKNPSPTESNHDTTLNSPDHIASGIDLPVAVRNAHKPAQAIKRRPKKPSQSKSRSTRYLTQGSKSTDMEVEVPENEELQADMESLKSNANIEQIGLKDYSPIPGTSQNSIAGSVSDTETSIPVKKSSRITKVNERRIKNASPTPGTSRNSTLSSTGGSISDTETPVPIKKSRRSTKVEKTKVKYPSPTLGSSNNSTLSSVGSSVSSTDSPVPVKKSRRFTNIEEAGLKDPFVSIQSGKKSTLSSNDGSVSGIKAPVPVNKLQGFTKVQTARIENPFPTLESSHNSTLISADGSVSSIESPLPVRKSRRSAKVENVRMKNSSPTPVSSQNSSLSSPDGSVSGTASPVRVRKSRRLTQVTKQSPKKLSNTRISSQDSTPTDVEVPENEESQNDMESLVVDDVIENSTTADESSQIETSERDLSKGSFRYSMTEVINASPPSSTNMDVEVGQIDESQKIDEVPKIIGKESPSEKSVDAHDGTLSSIQPVVLLTRLNDPVRISLRRRKKYSNLNSQLSVIPETLDGKSAAIIEETSEENHTPESSYPSSQIIRKYSVKLSGEGMVSQRATTSAGTPIFSNTINESRFDGKEDKPVYLKPGKSWARSLSILTKVHSQEEVESLAVGKGKKWRESANSVLQMQQQGILQSCVKKNADDKESQSVYGVRNSTAAAAAWLSESSQSDTSRVLSGTSPGRFVKRVSILVVPDGKNVEPIEDTPFLEVHGITACENRKTIGKRSTSIASRKTLVYNVQDVSYDNIPKSIINSSKSRDVVLKQCSQNTSLPFDECYPLSYLKHCRKIGEGVYGEVFLHEKGADKSVIKIIPIEGEMNVNNERQKKFDEILSEIVIAKELHSLRFGQSSNTSSFVEVKNIRCVVGNYPQKLIELWNTYDEEKNSENDCPAMFDENQLYIVLELGHGGEDLEAFVFQNASESHALFMQTAVALAVAEEKLDFEHRDLHWGNLLIARTEESHVEFKLRDKTIRLVSKGVKVSVIDFTLSRMSYQGCSIYNDLSMDEDLFAAQGEYQFEIYRLMRRKVENDWQRFEPFTNVLWLHYTLDKMITAARYRRTGSKIHINSIEKLRELKDTILNYESAYDFVTNCDKATRLQGSRNSVATIS